MSTFDFYIKKLQDLEYRGEWKEIYSHLYEKIHFILYDSHYLRRNYYLEQLAKYHEVFIDLPFAPDDEEKLLFRKTQKHIIDLLYQIREESKTIFLAHGRDTSLADKISSILGRLKLDYVTVDFGQSTERNFKEFNNIAKECGFAIIILGADDYARPLEGGPEKYRTSQNVILQLGYFLSHVGRKNVVILYPENKEIESPLNFDELRHAPIDQGGQWKPFLISKLAGSGLFIDEDLKKKIV